MALNEIDHNAPLHPIASVATAPFASVEQYRHMQMEKA